MSQSVDNIIPVEWNIKRSGQGAASFGVALAAYGDATTPEDKTMGLFTSYESVLERHEGRDDLLDCAKNWFDAGGATLITIGYAYVEPGGAAPTPPESDEPFAIEYKPKEGEEKQEAKKVTAKEARMNEMALKLAGIRSLDEPSTFEEAIMKAAQSAWFYFPFSTQTATPLTQPEIEAALSWCEANGRFLSLTVMDEKAIDPTVTDDLGAYLSSLGNRRCAVGYTTKNKYMGARMAGMMSMVNYTLANSYKDAEYKSINQAPDDLDGTAIATLQTKGYYFNTEIASKGSKTGALLQHTVSTSQYGESIAEVMATDSYFITVQNALLNVMIGQKNMPQTPDGQALALDSVNACGELYIGNGFLGQREVVHPTTKETVVTRGYITTTKPEDIYKLTDEQRAQRLLYPIEQYIYRAGSAWAVEVTINVW